MSKVWLITGCSTGFGNEIARAALEAGDEVVATARKVESMQELKDKYGEKVKLVQLDVTDSNSIQKAKEEALNWKGKIDVLVNNAGVGSVGSVEETPTEEYRRQFDINFFGLVNVTKAFLPSMREQKSGHIINISSVAGLLVMPGFGPYCATKHAVEAITESLGIEVGPLGIKATVIEPGAFRTKFVGHNLVEAPEMEEYKPTVGSTREMLKAMATQAQGDPAKLANIIVEVAHMQEPPVRLPIGADSMQWLKERIKTIESQWFAMEEKSSSTNFD